MKNAKLSLAAFAAYALLSAPAFGQSMPFPSTGGGTGSGDVTGPSSSTGDHLAGFNGTTGKVIKDLGIGPGDLAPAGVVADVTTSQSVHAADVAACKYYRVGASSLNFTFDATSTPLSTNGCIEIETGTNSAQVTANAADTVSFAGSTTATGGNVTLPAYGLYRITIKSGNIDIAGTGAQGNGPKTVRATGAFTTGNTVKIDAGGNIIDAGTTPGGGGLSPVNSKASRFYFTSPARKGSSSVMTPGTIYFSDFYVTTPITIDQLGSLTTTNDAAGHYADAIYATDATTGEALGAPLVTTASISTAAGITIDTAISSTSLPAGHYKFAHTTDSTTAKFLAEDGSHGYQVYAVGADTVAHMIGNASNLNTIYSITGTYGTWPTMNGTLCGTGNCTTISSGFNVQNFVGVYHTASVP